MKILVVLIFVLSASCSTINTSQYAKVELTSFDNELYQEYISDYRVVSRCEKTFVNYFEKEIEKRFKDAQWKSCHKNLTNDQKHYAQKWWALQGWLNFTIEQRKMACDIQRMLAEKGLDLDRQKEIIYKISLNRFYSTNQFDMCSYNPSIHQG